MPAPMVALPCGSRSTSNTRFGVRASAAARLTAVVVLPTPPFWLATAMMRAMRLVPWFSDASSEDGAGRRSDRGLCPPRRRLAEPVLAAGAAPDFEEVALGIQPGHPQWLRIPKLPAVRQGGDFILRVGAFHCQQHAVRPQQMAAQLQDQWQGRQCARGDGVVRTRLVQLLDAGF